MTKPVVVVVATFEESHFARVRPLVAALSATGADTYVFTDRCFEAEVAEDGGRFVDLYAGRPREVLADDSIPVAAREVTYAATYARSVLEQVASLNPGVIVYDTFAVIGRVVGHVLGIPYVNLSSGHNIDPARHLPELYANPRFHISDECHRAVEQLKHEYGIEGASPFFSMAALSPHLNVYGEPPQFLTEQERAVFEPVAFFGSLRAGHALPRNDRRPIGDARVDVYVSFGTVIWRHFVPAAVDALTTISRALSERPDTDALITLGGADLDADVLEQLAQPNVRVERYVDQWQALRDATLFVTHHGMKSTHEAVVSEVPMLSYPFFWDQPSMAAQCQALGLAVGLTDTPQGILSEADVHVALDDALANRAAMLDRLAEARQWELDVIAARPLVAQRILDLT
jgi:UDP:flavonoid glycosyltransferase YjiC (YdhE family)